MTIQGNQAPYWSQPATALLAELRGTPEGLCTADASWRLAHFGPNALGARKRTTALVAFLNQFKNPLTLILIFAAALSAFMQEWTDIAIIIVLGSAALSFFQGFRATTAV